MKRIGLFGGTFDPVHNAHLALARSALEALQLDELHWIPAGLPWQKARLGAEAVHRAAMVALAIQGEARFRLDRIELARAQPSYTVDTVEQLQAAAQSSPSGAEADEAQWFLLIGQDQYANLQTWHRWHALVQRVVLAVAARGGAVPLACEALSRVPHRMVTLPMPEMPISSTDIRARLGAGMRAESLAPAWLPAEVARYIDQHGLYGTPPAHATSTQERT